MNTLNPNTMNVWMVPPHDTVERLYPASWWVM
jgi:hypothetical protein